MSTEEHIKQQLKNAQFDLAGITKPSLPEKYTKRYQEWLDNKFHGNLEYMKRSRERRLHPEKVLRGVKSVVVCAINYYKQNPKLRPNEGNVARYAQGEDYHHVIEQYAADFLHSTQADFPEAKWKFSVDYGHILERAYAEQAGIGFIGKNGNLITREYGSYVFLATFLTTLTLKPDKPANERLGKCGTCDRCLRNCPTKAILRPGLINATKCVSYWTIENKTDTIPKHIAAKAQKRVFGCDICQEVCPHNVRAKQTRHTQLQPNQQGPQTLSDESLHDSAIIQGIKQKTTAFTRASKKGLQRNIYHILSHAPGDNSNKTT